MRVVKTLLVLCLLGMGWTTSQAAQIFPKGTSWKYMKGTQEASSPDRTAWRQLGFNDASWLTGNSAFYYETGTGYTGNTDLSDMNGSYSCIFMRKIFTIADPSSVSSLQFNLESDDGCVIWINGVEVASLGRPNDPILFNSVALNADGEPKTGTPIVAPASMLQAGNNVIAVQAFNNALSGSTDFLINLSLVSTAPDFVAPTITSVSPTPGNINALTQVTVNFSEDVSGVDPSDLLFNGFPADTISGGPQSYTFSFPQPAYGTVAFQWVSAHGIIDFAFPPNNFDATAPTAQWQYNLIDIISPTVTRLVPPAGLIVRDLTQIEVEFSENVVGVEAGDLRIADQPAQSITVRPGNIFVFHFPPPPTGSVQVAWIPAHGITDQAVAPNAFAGGAWSYTLDPNAPAADLVLNEINAANVSGLLDESGEASDWIEIWNRGGSAIDLAGWSLSDDDDLPDKWVFPSYILGANKYVVVFASAKNIKAPTGANRFHTNFKLADAGDHIGLYSPDAPPIPAEGLFGEYPAQRNNHSYGLDTSGTPRYFATPTPGAANGDSDIVGVTEPVHFSVHRGYFEAPFTLTLSSATRGASIYYTTNGTTPAAGLGQRYLGPLTVTNTTLLRAIAVRDHYLPSIVGTHSYLFNLSAAFRSLPIISIVSDSNHLYGPSGIMGINGGSGPPNNVWVSGGAGTYHNPSFSMTNGLAWERPTSIEWIEDNNSGFQIDAGVRVHGSTWTRPRYVAGEKMAFKVYFREGYGAGRLEFPWFPESVDNQQDEVVLRDGHNDASNPFIIDELLRRLHFDMGQVATLGTFGNLMINGVPNVAAGGQFYYNPCSRVKEAFLQAWHGGGLAWDIIAPFGDNQGDGDRVAWTVMLNLIRNQVNTSLQSWYQQVEQQLDTVNFIDYLLVNIYASTWDWPHNNWRAARERVPSGIFRFYVWDAEGGFYIHSTRTSVVPPHAHNMFLGDGAGGDASDLQNADEIATFYRQLRGNAEFRMLFADRIQKHFFNNGALLETNITWRFNQLRTNLLGVLPGMDLRIRNEWIPGRRPFLMTQFSQQGLLAPLTAPSFSQHGGLVPNAFQLSMSAPAGTVYYTTDGIDPRVKFTGAIGPSAVAYATPITLNQSMLIKARAYNGTDWSALTEAPFQIASLGIPVRITEIMYNPIGGNTAHEYVEIQNVGTAPVTASGFSFEGIDFTFPDPTFLMPNQIYLIASDNDPNAFALRYPGVVPNNYFSGSLANNGERLVLKDREQHIIVSVDFHDGGGWPEKPDGLGYSLENIAPLGAADEPSNWRSSLAVGGSPGQANAASPAASVVLNEVLAENIAAVPNGSTFPDYVELRNTTASPISLAQWSLTDDGNERKFIFPADARSTIPALGYLIVWCDDAGSPTPGLHAGFALDRNQETILLYDQNTNRVDAISYGNQVADYSIGRVGSQWVLNTPTAGANNAAATLAPASSLSINEWMANPFPGFDDWIELHNKSTTSPVSLTGIYLQAGDDIHQLTSLAFLPPLGFIQIHADEGEGADHVDFNLPATGATITLSDPVAVLIDSVAYPPEAEGISRGRFPDGTATIVTFPGTASPGVSNHRDTYTGPFLNEVLARNEGAVTSPAGTHPDFVEIFNGGGTAFNLSGMSLSVDEAVPGQWVFPTTTSIPANSYLIVWCDGTQPATTNAGGLLNTGRSLNGSSGSVYLFNLAGQAVDFVEYGFQVENKSIGLVTGQWRLLNTPSAGTINGAAATLAAATNLRINEWMANPDDGDDWFELYNTHANPADMSGIFLSDDPSLSGTTNHIVAPLSFIGGLNWVRWEAQSSPGKGRNHVDFNLDAQGETLRLYNTNKTLIDSVYFENQSEDASQGRLPDGSDSFVTFDRTASPERSNYLPLPVVINEALTHTDPPFEDAIELYNTSSSPVTIGGWYLSDNHRNFKKFQIPAGTTLTGNGYVVFYQNQFDDGTPNAFALDSAHGGTIWLSEAGPGNSLTGNRSVAEFGAAENPVSFGRLQTSVGVDFTAMSQRSFGADNPPHVAAFRTGTGLPNPAPKVGPVVINEVMYHPMDQMVGTTPVDNTIEEFIELHNFSSEDVSLYDPAFNTNRWNLRGNVDYDFATGTVLPAGKFLLLVSFDPVTNLTALAQFKTKYGLNGQTVTILGPYQGKLNNGSGSLKLYRPDAPQTTPGPDFGFVPQILEDRLDYKDHLPWPAGGTDGGGLSLQKPAPNVYGNEPLNLVADNPTPGAVNGTGLSARPVITQSPTDRSAFPGTVTQFNVGVSGTGPFTYQWRYNGQNIPNAIAASYVLDPVIVPDDGMYDVLVGSAGGSALSASARLRVTAPPVVTVDPASQSVRGGVTVVFAAAASGPAPLTYQWRRNGVNLPGANGSSLTLNNVGLAEAGIYEFVVTNPNATVVSAPATLVVLVDPVVLINPLSQTVVQGEDLTLSILTTGTLPMSYRWRSGSSTVYQEELNSWQAFFTITNVQATLHGGSGRRFTVVLTNAAFFSPGTLSLAATLTVLTDFDGDRVPDAYEIAHHMDTNNVADAAGDLDLDGQSNREEYLAGTDPEDEDSYLKVESLTKNGQGTSIRFKAIATKSYTLQYRDDIPGAPWQLLQNVVAPIATGEITILDPGVPAGGKRFYRLATPKL